LFVARDVGLLVWAAASRGNGLAISEA